MIDLHFPGLDFLGIVNSYVAYLNVWDWANSEWPKNSAFSYVSHWIFCNDFWVFSGTGKVAVCWWTGVWSLCKSPVGSPQCSLQNLLPVSERLISSTSCTGFISNYPDNCSMHRSYGFHYYIIHEPILGISVVGDCLFLCELRLLMVCLLEGPFSNLLGQSMWECSSGKHLMHSCL